MYDIVTKIGDSVFQHGKYNDRIYLMKLSFSDFPDIIYELDKMAQANGYSKICAKVPQYAKDDFLKKGFIVEAHIPNFYNGKEDVVFMGKFFNKQRIYNAKSEETDKVLQEARRKAAERKIIKPVAGYYYKICEAQDAPEMAEVYKRVFETYPFPIHDPGYIVGTHE